MCPRVFHLKCAGMDKEPEEDWACSECHAVMQAENIENRYVRDVSSLYTCYCV